MTKTNFEYTTFYVSILFTSLFNGANRFKSIYYTLAEEEAEVSGSYRKCQWKSTEVLEELQFSSGKINGFPIAAGKCKKIKYY